MKKITPNIDLQNSIQRDRVLESRDFYKGKSFRYSVWAVGHPYHNDEWYIDFVSHEGVLYACKKNHISSTPPSEHSAEWTFVMAGTPGQDGQVYVPAYNENTGELTWSLQDKSSEKITLQLVSKKDIENFVTNEKIANFATQSWVSDQGFLTNQDISGFATKEEVSDAIESIEIPSVEGLATESWVSAEIAKAQLEGEDVDLSGYATKDDIKGFATKEETEAIKTWVGEQGFITEHQSLEGYVTKEYVTKELEDLSSTYATKTEVQKLTTEIQNLTIDGGELKWQ